MHFQSIFRLLLASSLHDRDLIVIIKHVNRPGINRVEVSFFNVLSVLMAPCIQDDAFRVFASISLLWEIMQGFCKGIKDMIAVIVEILIPLDRYFAEA